MEWILEHRPRVRDALDAAAERREELRLRVYAADRDYRAAQAEEDAIEKLLAALDQLDPATRVGEPPL